MAAKIPNALKIADITRFATKAIQIEKVKPEVAYWCKKPYLNLNPF
jgi:vacuolar protein sorting-associated protein VTA1